MAEITNMLKEFKKAVEGIQNYDVDSWCDGYFHDKPTQEAWRAFYRVRTLVKYVSKNGNK